MTPKFTPGPWSLDISGRFFSILNREGDDVCAFPDQDGKSPTAEQIANATLIASAPDLYAALEAVCDAYGCECVEPTAHCPMCIGRAALAKARDVKGV